MKQLEKMYVFERDNYLIIILKNVMSEVVEIEVLVHHQTHQVLVEKNHHLFDGLKHLHILGYKLRIGQLVL
ncbi:MAG: hypothetical protein LBU14_05480 [Candidatus Peribacteria bacterium]|nr:hypothetical protein [Candidatus Peribacteria bacterium]